MYTIIGANGFIGSHLKTHLAKRNADIFTPSRGDLDLYERNLGIVFYCAGLTQDFKDRPHDTINSHVSTLSALLNTAKFERLIYLSSARLYDGQSSTTEDTNLTLNPSNPRHIYDLSKALGEALCLHAANGKACAARLSSVYSDHPLATGFVPDLLRRLKTEIQFTLQCQSGMMRDYIHIDDVIDALCNLAAAKNMPAIINIASGQNISNENLARVLNQNGCTISLAKNTPLQTIPAINIDKLKALGLQPKSISETIKQYL